MCVPIVKRKMSVNTVSDKGRWWEPSTITSLLERSHRTVVQPNLGWPGMGWGGGGGWGLIIIRTDVKQ